MPIVLKEHSYLLKTDSETRVLRVEELIAGPAIWKGKFRAEVPSQTANQVQTIYGASADEVAVAASRFLQGHIESEEEMLVRRGIC